MGKQEEEEYLSAKDEVLGGEGLMAKCRRGGVCDVRRGQHETGCLRDGSAA